MSEIEIEPVDEILKVEDWRLKQLIYADFPTDVAVAIAARHDIDLHQALGLVRSGCTPELAAAILL